jgi:3-deoxy-manno-octulosonate cytidylyltransferase (CMP-KDO synthetase)
MSSSSFKTGILIPARMGSARLYGKPLMQFEGLPMIEHVRRRALLNSHDLDVIVVSPDREILEIVVSNGGNVFESKIEHPNGLSRVGEALRELNWSHFILVQGDEILVVPSEIDQLASLIKQNPNFEFVNCVAPINQIEDLNDISIVKGIVNSKNSIPFMFRSNPFTGSEKLQLEASVKILGLFGMQTSVGIGYSEFGSSLLEELESIEQLRLIQNAAEIKALRLPKGHPSVNVAADIEKVSKILNDDSEQNEILKRILAS